MDKKELARWFVDRTDGWAHYFLARVDSEETGLLVLDILDRPRCGVVREIFVAPSFRQRGVADVLLRHAQTVAASSLLPTLELEVL
ncbi:hypothetical protein WI89_12295 [Burkholderia ubonensis]|uniref:GNAT family N-acetyltransferase n=1 Tax=Burkholderia ubonensis TaxID=101571 RepID=UPI00075DA99E|nr:GNAT family N-acetyltransferase [Burkholderia ubonensis]KVD73288.1 hypothetical protein WI89_12295 [Burkholderia ubonensis]